MVYDGAPRSVWTGRDETLMTRATGSSQGGGGPGTELELQGE